VTCSGHGREAVRLRKGGWLRCTRCGHRVQTGRRKVYQTRSRPWLVLFELAGRFRAKRPVLRRAGMR
jgi:hypothetical protein